MKSLHIALCMTLYFMGCSLTAAINSEEPTCRVPPYSLNLHEVNLTAENEELLLTEGSCYLGCLADGFDYQVRLPSYYVFQVQLVKP